MLNLKKLRLEKGLSQQALADNFNLSQQSIYKYEHELAEPDIKTLKCLARFFDVSIDYLVGFADDSDDKDNSTLTKISASDVALLQEIKKLPPNVQETLSTLVSYLQTSQSHSD